MQKKIDIDDCNWLLKILIVYGVINLAFDIITFSLGFVIGFMEGFG